MKPHRSISRHPRDVSLADDVPAPPKPMDAALLFMALATANILTMHGKQLSAAILDHDPHLLWDSAYTFGSYLAVILGAAAIVWIGFAQMRATPLVLALSAAAVVFPLISQAFSHGRSALILFLQVYVSAVVGMVFVLQRTFRQRMGLEFWDKTVAMGIRAMRFGLILYGAGVTILKFLSDGLKEGKEGFLTTLLYPTFVLLFSFLIVTAWIIVPAWERATRLRSLGHVAAQENENDKDELPELPTGKPFGE